MKIGQIFFYALVLILSLAACTNAPETKEEKPSQHAGVNQDSLAICELMKAQQTAWNFGDIDTFMKTYWKSDSLQFVGKSGLKLGWNTTLENYKKSYPTKEAMGRLQFNNLHIETIDGQAAYVIGKWQVFRVADTLGGHYSLFWRKIQSKWVIVSDHTS